jgi:hypothetical protein
MRLVVAGRSILPGDDSSMWLTAVRSISLAENCGREPLLFDVDRPVAVTR